jgi:hypothetical protein
MIAPRFYSQRSCNDDYVPTFTRGVHVPNNLEDSNSSPNFGVYTDANIQFGSSSKGEFTFTQLDKILLGHDHGLGEDKRLKEIDAQIEAFYKTETIVMELNLSEPEDDNRPSFDNVGIRVEDFDLSYYHYHTIASFEKKPVNVFAKKTMSDEISFDCLKGKK